MRGTIAMGVWGRGLGAVVVLGAAYWAWPLVGAAQLAATVRGGDPAEITAATDLPRLRHSLARQIARAYLTVSGKADKLGPTGRSLAGAAVTTVADPYVDELLTPGNIAALLSQGRIGQVKLGDRTVAIKGGTLPTVSNLLDGNLLSTLTGSYFDAPTDFVVPVTGPAGTADQYGVHLRLDGLSWKLAGLDLPPALVEEMARSLLDEGGPAKS